MTDIIQRLQDQKNEYGVSLFSHLLELFQQLCEKKSIYANYDAVELLSDLIKKNHFLYNPLKKDNELVIINQSKSLQSQWVNDCFKLLEKQTLKNKFYVQNFFVESKLFENANVYFGEDESYQIQQSIIKLAQKESATQIRFWGKIFCRNKDYYIAEGNINTTYRDKAPSYAENCGSGCNKLTFWATNDILNQWTELPQIYPEHIKSAKKLKFIMSGNLNSEIESYPKFPGLESHFLKTQLVRITYSSLLIPKGIYKINEELPAEIDIDEEGKMPELPELQQIDNWVHQYPNILNQGRISYFVNPNLTEEEKEAELGKLGETDPIIERLKAPTEEKPIEGYEANFAIKTVGSTQMYSQVGSSEGSVQSYHTIVVKSNIWPGMTTVAKTGVYASLYVGYGMKNIKQSFEPSKPNDIQNDPEDQIENYEPNPKNAPKIVEKGEDDKKDEE